LSLLIFLYRFDKHKNNGIDFVLNEGIAEDMYSDLEQDLLKPLVRAACKTLMLYKSFSKTDTIMTGTILDTNEFEVMLSEGLGSYINLYEKSILFEQAKLIADILIKVMDRRSQGWMELKDGSLIRKIK